MSEWRDGYFHVDKWLRAEARLEGAIEAHRTMKRGKGDRHDETLWTLTNEVIAELEAAITAAKEGTNG